VVHSAGFSKGGQWPQLLSSKRRDSANVVEDRDADLERYHPIVQPVDYRPLYAGEVFCVTVRQAHRLLARLDELGRPSVCAVDVVRNCHLAI
jgi:hypothetical protein